MLPTAIVIAAAFSDVRIVTVILLMLRLLCSVGCYSIDEAALRLSLQLKKCK
jgi:hypothetical protein